MYHKENSSLKLAVSVATRWESRNYAIVKIFGKIDFWIKDDLRKENELKFCLHSTVSSSIRKIIF